MRRTEFNPPGGLKGLTLMASNSSIGEQCVFKVVTSSHLVMCCPFSVSFCSSPSPIFLFPSYHSHYIFRCPSTIRCSTHPTSFIIPQYLSTQEAVCPFKSSPGLPIVCPLYMSTSVYILLSYHYIGVRWKGKTPLSLHYHHVVLPLLIHQFSWALYLIISLLWHRS